MFARLGQAALASRQTRVVRTVVRRMGGGGATGAPHPSQPKQAYLFNELPGRKVESWEWITSITYWTAFFLLVGGLWNKPETSIQEWAAEEAEVRLARMEKGEPVEYGVYYHQHNKNKGKRAVGGYKNSTAAGLDEPTERREEEEAEE